MLINLKPRDTRSSSASEVIRRLQRDTRNVEGIMLFMQPAQDLTIDSTVSRTQYQFVLESPNAGDFDVWVPRLMDRLSHVPEITDVATELQSKGLTMFIKIDRDAAAHFGITAATVDNVLYDAYGQRIVSTVYTQTNQYRVIYEIDPAKCTECVGHFDKPQCQIVCPVDCIPLDPQHAETREELEAKYRRLAVQKQSS